jgi:hypothetical protein
MNLTPVRPVPPPAGVLEVRPDWDWENADELAYEDEQRRLEGEAVDEEYPPEPPR